MASWLARAARAGAVVSTADDLCVDGTDRNDDNRSPPPALVSAHPKPTRFGCCRALCCALRPLLRPPLSAHPKPSMSSSFLAAVDGRSVDARAAAEVEPAVAELLTLPEELRALILANLDARILARVAVTCKALARSTGSGVQPSHGPAPQCILASAARQGFGLNLGALFAWQCITPEAVDEELDDDFMHHGIDVMHHGLRTDVPQHAATGLQRGFPNVHLKRADDNDQRGWRGAYQM